MHMGHFIDYIYLLKGLAVEGFDTGLEGIVDLLVALSDSGIYDLVGWETAVKSMQNFVSADTVSSETLAADILQQPSLNVCLDCIMYLNAILFSHFCSRSHCLAMQIHVIVVKRCGDLVKLFYCIDT